MGGGGVGWGEDGGGEDMAIEREMVEVVKSTMGEGSLYWIGGAVSRARDRKRELSSLNWTD